MFSGWLQESCVLSLGFISTEVRGALHSKVLHRKLACEKQTELTHVPSGLEWVRALRTLQARIAFGGAMCAELSSILSLRGNLNGQMKHSALLAFHANFKRLVATFPNRTLEGQVV